MQVKDTYKGEYAFIAKATSDVYDEFLNNLREVHEKEIAKDGTGKYVLLISDLTKRFLRKCFHRSDSWIDEEIAKWKEVKQQWDDVTGSDDIGTITTTRGEEPVFC